jgi:hypothetical protein
MIPEYLVCREWCARGYGCNELCVLRVERMIECTGYDTRCANPHLFFAGFEVDVDHVTWQCDAED